MRKMNASSRKRHPLILLFIFILFLSAGCGGRTASGPLMLPVLIGDIAMLQKRIRAGADLNEKDNYGDTALIAATQSGHIEIAKALIKSRADLNAKDKRGSAALWVATLGDHSEIVKALFKAGANVNPEILHPGSPQEAKAHLPRNFRGLSSICRADRGAVGDW